MSNELHMDRRSKYSIQVIRQALFELLETKSLDEITVVDVCRTADVNRGTFYKYYRDVSDLYDKIEDSLVEKIYALMQNSDGRGLHQNSFFKEILNLLAADKEFTYIAQNKTFSERLAKKLLSLFTPHLQKMMQANYPHTTKTDSTLLLEYILGGCIRVISYWLKNDMKIPVDELNRDLSVMISHSLSVLK